jgi:hypothetical protein
VAPSSLAIQFYVISSLLVGYIGLIVIAILKPLENKPFYVLWFEAAFPYVALVFMAGFYYFLIQTGLSLFWSTGLFVNAFLGLWVVINAVFSILKKWNQLQILALAAVDILLIATIIPGINAVDLSTEIYKFEFVSILERNNMIDEVTNSIIPQPGGLNDADDEARLKDLVDEMGFIGYHRFPYLPEDYQISEFLSVFGFLPDGSNGEDNVIFLSYTYEYKDFLDLSQFDYSTVLYLNYLPFETIITQGWTVQYTSNISTLSLENDTTNLEIDLSDVMIEIFQAMDEVNSNLNIQDLTPLTVELEGYTVFVLSVSARYDLDEDLVTDINGTFLIGID